MTLDEASLYLKRKYPEWDEVWEDYDWEGVIVKVGYYNQTTFMFDGSVNTYVFAGDRTGVLKYPPFVRR